MIDSNKISLAISEAISLIKKWEGLELIIYKCPANFQTIGYGHRLTKEDQESGNFDNAISIETAERILAEDIRILVKQIDSLVKVDLSAEQLAGLISLVYNIGIGAFTKSTLLSKLNSGDNIGAANEFGRWSHIKSKKSTGLISRRKDEMDMFAKKKQLIYLMSANNSFTDNSPKLSNTKKNNKSIFVVLRKMISSVTSFWYGNKDEKRFI